MPLSKTWAEWVTAFTTLLAAANRIALLAREVPITNSHNPKGYIQRIRRHVRTQSVTGIL